MDEPNLISLSTICRGCLSDRREALRSIFNSNILDIFMRCTNLEVDASDGLPANLCTSCVFKCVSWHSFKQQCEQTDLILRDQLIVKQCKSTENSKNILTKFPEVDEICEEIEKSVDNSTDCTEIVEDSVKTNILTIEDEQENVIIEVNDSHLDSTANEASNDSKCPDTATEECFEESGQLTEEFMITNNTLDVTEYDDDFVVEEDETFEMDIEKDNPAKSVVEELEKASKKFEPRGKFVCNICLKIFRLESRLIAHHREHLGQKPEVCKVCGKEFNNQRALRRHRQKHNDLKQYACTECGRTYKYQTSLTLHRKIHQNVRSFVCDLCGKSFVRAHGLQSHQLTHQSETPYACEECGKSFKNAIMLRNHQMRHTGIKKFICTECGKLFASSAELTIHHRTHTGQKPYKCSMCDKCYTTKSHLSVHFRSHSGERPYACDICPMKFAHNKVFKQHRLTHTGERPHVCEICNRPFRQKSTLNVHMRTHKKLLLSDNNQQYANIILLDIK